MSVNQFLESALPYCFLGIAVVLMAAGTWYSLGILKKAVLLASEIRSVGKSLDEVKSEWEAVRIAALAQSTSQPQPLGAGVRRRFTRLNREGLNENEIAERLGLPPAVVDLLIGVTEVQAK